MFHVYLKKGIFGIFRLSVENISYVNSRKVSYHIVGAPSGISIDWLGAFLRDVNYLILVTFSVKMLNSNKNFNRVCTFSISLTK